MVLAMQVQKRTSVTDAPFHFCPLIHAGSTTNQRILAGAATAHLIVCICTQEEWWVRVSSDINELAGPVVHRAQGPR
jgi:hypothetical protein